MRLDSAGWPIVDHAGDPAVVLVPTKRTMPLSVPAPLGVVWHWTAGDYPRDRGHADSLALANWIAEKPPVKDAPAAVIAAAVKRGVSLVSASWHLLGDKDGTLVVSAPANVGTWHVADIGLVRGVKRRPNTCLVGYELENAGRLRAIAGRMYAWPYYVDASLPPDRRKPDPRYEVDKARAVPARGGLFDAFTPAQEAAAIAWLKAAVAAYGWGRADCSHGHRDFTPAKEDPGPLWADTHLPRVLDAVFG